MHWDTRTPPFLPPGTHMYYTSLRGHQCFETRSLAIHRWSAKKKNIVSKHSDNQKLLYIHLRFYNCNSDVLEPGGWGREGWRSNSVTEGWVGGHNVQYSDHWADSLESSVLTRSPQKHITLLKKKKENLLLQTHINSYRMIVIHVC